MNELKKLICIATISVLGGIIVCWMCQETGRKEDRDKQ